MEFLLTSFRNLIDYEMVTEQLEESGEFELCSDIETTSRTLLQNNTINLCMGNTSAKLYGQILCSVRVQKTDPWPSLSFTIWYIVFVFISSGLCPLSCLLSEAET